MISHCVIHIGTSGWSYPRGEGTWKGYFYASGKINWTFIAFMLIIAVYDVVAVRLGYMLWMAERFSDSGALPGFIFPRGFASWNLDLKQVRVGELKEKEPEERDYAVLGGGDIGFPLMLAVAVFFSDGLAAAIIVSAFALAGLMGAFLLQLLWLRGKPMPTLPPIAAGSLIGFLLVSAFL
jgi:presenilin-like A22 family membrane protease